MVAKVLSNTQVEKKNHARHMLPWLPVSDAREGENISVYPFSSLLTIRRLPVNLRKDLTWLFLWPEWQKSLYDPIGLHVCMVG